MFLTKKLAGSANEKGPVILWFNRSCPQNYLIHKPYKGALVAAPIYFLFLILYTPLNIHPSNTLSFELTMAIYSSLAIIPQLGIIVLLKKSRFFSTNKDWTILKEIASIVLTLLGMGVFIYFMGFLVEGPEGRLRLATFLDSIKITFLTCFVVFFFFSVLNFRFWTHSPPVNSSAIYETPNPLPTQEVPIHINSRLKNEELKFLPSEFVLAQSNSNYVIFYLMRNGSIHKEMIRNSITDIENQLDRVPGIFRTHRAFLVNLKKVNAVQGNSLGYKLQLQDIDEEIPVARNKVRTFNEQIKQYQ